MNHMYFISLKDLAHSTVLAGGAAGTAVQREILRGIERQPTQLCCLDFAGVECATASFIREAVFGSRDAVRRADVDVQIVVVNATPTVQEELLLVARALGSSIVHAFGASARELTCPSVLGPLDEAQRETLAMVLRLGEATATDLSAEKPTVKPTAWNNRLATLVQRGLLIEGKRDRHNVYRPVLKGLTYGS